MEEKEETKLELVNKYFISKQDTNNDLCNGIALCFDEIGLSTAVFQLQLTDMDPTEEGYKKILSERVYQTFGIRNVGLARQAISDCIGVYMGNVEPTDLGKFAGALKVFSTNIISLYNEVRPRDAFELMMVTKMITLDFLSNREFVNSASSKQDEFRTSQQKRGIKLSRLFLEFKDKFDKHRKPEQLINVQHNHIYKDGKAIIGSNLNSGG